MQIFFRFLKVQALCLLCASTPRYPYSVSTLAGAPIRFTQTSMDLLQIVLSRSKQCSLTGKLCMRPVLTNIKTCFGLCSELEVGDSLLYWRQLSTCIRTHPKFSNIINFKLILLKLALNKKS